MVGYHEACFLIIIPKQHFIKLDDAVYARELPREMSLKPDIIIELVFDIGGNLVLI
jgi:hypothetical protein